MSTVATSIGKENLTRKKGGIKKGGREGEEREKRVRRKQRKSGRDMGTEWGTVGEQKGEGGVGK